MDPNQRANGKVSTKLRLKTHRAINHESKKEKGIAMNRKTINTALALMIAGSLTTFAQTPDFNNVKPSTTGVPGEEVGR